MRWIATSIKNRCIDPADDAAANAALHRISLIEIGGQIIGKADEVDGDFGEMTMEVHSFFGRSPGLTAPAVIIYRCSVPA